MRKRKNRYTGELAKPIVFDGRLAWLLSSLPLKSDSRLGERLQRARDAYVRDGQALKIPLLLEHYGISASNPDAWKELALALANEHVDGFQLIEPPRRGRPKWWNAARLAALVTAVDEIKRQGARDDTDAIRKVVKRAVPGSQWAAPKTKAKTTEQWVKTLHNRLLEARAEHYALEKWLNGTPDIKWGDAKIFFKPVSRK